MEFLDGIELFLKENLGIVLASFYILYFLIISVFTVRESISDKGKFKSNQSSGDK